LRLDNQHDNKPVAGHAKGTSKILVSLLQAQLRFVDQAIILKHSIHVSAHHIGTHIGSALQSRSDARVCARGEFPWREVVPYIIVQCAGGVAGTVIAHLMFDLPPLMIGTTARSGPSQWLAEMVATFALVLTILGGLRYAAQAVPWLVGLVITAAYWVTSSTSFANPAVTLARGLTTTFAGIAINHVPAFIVAQLVGAFVAVLLAICLFPSAKQRRESDLGARQELILPGE
jgi:hypothetical protein